MREAIREMHRQVGLLRFDRHGLARRGLLVRHLVMPGQLAEAEQIFSWIASAISPDTWVNVMDQYRPVFAADPRSATGRGKYADVARRPGRQEVTQAFRAARSAGLTRLDARW